MLSNIWPARDRKISMGGELKEFPRSNTLDFATAFLFIALISIERTKSNRRPEASKIPEVNTRQR